MNESLVKEALLEYRRTLLGGDLVEIAREVARVEDTYAVDRARHLLRVDEVLKSKPHISMLAKALSR